MESEMKHSMNSVLLHSAAGILFGAASPFFGRALYAVMAGMFLAVLLARITKMMTGKGTLNWWVSNGLFIYLFVWIDAWIIMANIWQ